MQKVAVAKGVFSDSGVMKFSDLPRTEEEAVAFLQLHGILPVQRICPNGHNAKLYFVNRIHWKCNVNTCRKKVSLRKDTWFINTRLPFVTAVQFLYSWAFELTSIKWCKRELGLNKNTVTDWNSYMRDVCVAAFKKKTAKIGGDGFIVEVDESLFTRRKNNAGRVLPQQWIFGGICRETSECFVVTVEDRSAATLLAAIKEHVKEGSTIYSDSWRGYQTTELDQAHFKHVKVNHRYNFVDPNTGVHTQNVERMWGSAKWRNKRHRGTARHHLESYLAEFAWRQQLGDKDPFDAILDAIKMYLPP